MKTDRNLNAHLIRRTQFLVAWRQEALLAGANAAANGINNNKRQRRMAEAPKVPPR